MRRKENKRMKRMIKRRRRRESDPEMNVAADAES